MKSQQTYMLQTYACFCMQADDREFMAWRLCGSDDLTRRRCLRGSDNSEERERQKHKTWMSPLSKTARVYKVDMIAWASIFPSSKDIVSAMHSSFCSPSNIFLLGKKDLTAFETSQRDFSEFWWTREKVQNIRLLDKTSETRNPKGESRSVSKRRHWVAKLTSIYTLYQETK